MVSPSGSGPSRGGRAADRWEFRGDAGHIGVATLGVHHLRVALADLGGTILDRVEISWGSAHEPVPTCERIASELDRMLAEFGVARPWGISIGMPAPVDAATGRNLDPIRSLPQTPRWPVDFDTRQWFSRRFVAPTWTESVSNLCALGAATRPGTAGGTVVSTRTPAAGR